MKGKEIIENVTKGSAYTPKNDDKATTNMKRVWIKTKSGNWAFVLAYGLSEKESLANANMICEAFNVANQTGLTPSQLKQELEKAKELLKKCKEPIEELNGEFQDGWDELLNELTTFLENSGLNKNLK